jgi:hypothetical protein
MFGLKEFKMRMLLVSLFLILSACAAPQNASDIKVAEPATTTPTEASEASSAKANSSKALAAEVGVVDYSCKQDSDCAIKDVGSCCGASPACVNKDSKTFPEQVQAKCKADGMSSICGFPSISSCSCKNNKCEGVSGPMAEGNVQ